ncbi:TPA: hypothetical protein QH712_003896 [Serratia liquefaciens]|uniref:hypothetical protein n=1 Tax=Serratia liquefaciens TaxID=614 RepID=UPI0021BD9261|nr:hypothetical protein [Serratia liquefaciens]HDS8360253.1 hypothetical protein [Serratia liquefaciens]
MPSTVKFLSDAKYQWWISPPKDFGQMFEAGQKGFAFNFTKPDGLYQDNAITTAVNASGQPIAVGLDQSGNSANFTSLSGQRTLYQYYNVADVYGAYGDGSVRKGRCALGAFLNTTEVTLMITGLLSADSTTPGPLFRLQDSTTFESFISLNADGLRVRRVPGEAEAASAPIAVRGERFLLTARINFASGVMEIRKNGKFVQDVTLTSKGLAAVTNSTASFFGTFNAGTFARGFIHEVALINEWLPNELIIDYEDKLKTDAKM